VSDAVRLQGMPQLNGAYVSIVEGEDVPDMVKAMVEQEADMNRASEDVGKNEARLDGIQSGKSHLLPGQAIEDVTLCMHSTCPFDTMFAERIDRRVSKLHSTHRQSIASHTA
jgi:hypothetical protein